MASRGKSLNGKNKILKTQHRGLTTNRPEDPRDGSLCPTPDPDPTSHGYLGFIYLAGEKSLPALEPFGLSLPTLRGSAPATPPFSANIHYAKVTISPGITKLYIPIYIIWHSMKRKLGLPIFIYPDDHLDISGGSIYKLKDRIITALQSK